MTTAATITANLVLDSKGYQNGLKKAGVATEKFRTKFQQLTALIKTNAAAIDAMGDRFRDAGKKMTTFVSLPIVAFFTMVTKKAMDADTALGKMARESLGKLNEQLTRLGEKFLPLVVKALDYLTNTLEKFNNAPPHVQKLIFILLGLVALAGPLMGFVGTIFNVVSAVSTMGGAISGAIPVIIEFGAALWGALAPILPVLLLIAATIVLIYLLWKNWDQLGVTLSQLWFIIQWGFEKMWEGIKSALSSGLDWLKKEVSKSNDVWTDNFRQAQEIQQKLFALSVEFMTKTWTDFVGKVTAKIAELRNWAMNAWNYIANAFGTAFQYIGNFANSIITGIIGGINSLIQAVNSLGFSLKTLEVPDVLKPGSPTPFEMGLRGIGKAMDMLAAKSIPEMNAAFAPPGGIGETNGGATVHYVDNRRYSSGLTKDVLNLALNDRFDGLVTAMKGI